MTEKGVSLLFTRPSQLNPFGFIRRSLLRLPSFRRKPESR
jgi:hypothetical protein